MNAQVENRRDVALAEESGTFRLRAAAIILRDNRVMMARNPRDPFLYTVGGAVKLGESAEDAVRREVWEETGTHLEVDRLVVVHENFFGFEDHPFHEVAFYFLMHDSPDLHEGPNPAEDDGPGESHLWVPIADLGRIRAYPEFFTRLLPALPEVPVHLVTHEVPAVSA